ncbi:hypothetical protein EDB38_12351 [Vibrio crassostreae]|nr:hypothetical protein EDB42_1257 [Vibrio crassostreae]TCT69955.1 hypothetical protein EDB41_12551 [Vibrio crassostreae]TCT90068.1 hypothetical protein EDB38_12351 [Vibrio crassostreae]
MWFAIANKEWGKTFQPALTETKMDKNDLDL